MINAPKSNIEESKSSTTDVVLWDSESLSEVLKQQIPTGLEITGVSIDSRSVKKGDLFVGVIGDRYNGSDFALEALNNGAVLCIVDQLPEDIEGFEKSFVVASDTLEAFEADRSFCA
jgi:UDP-N-acetylmuramoyl-tripeptide--D-alanyl-D-alanine ligase